MLGLLALAVAWSVTPLAQLFDPAVVARYEQRVRDWPFAPLAVMAIFVLSGLVAAPASLMVGATVVLFGAWPGALYAYGAMIVNGILVYTIGRFAARRVVDEWLAKRDGSRLLAINRSLGRRGFATIAAMRLLPVPYTLQNIVAGASRIGFADFVLGTALGIVPAVVLVTGVATRFDAWLADPDPSHLLALAGVLVVVGLVGWSLRRWARRHVAER